MAWLELTWTGLHIAFSPNACVAVTLDSDGHMQLRAMEHSFGSTEGLYDESMYLPDGLSGHFYEIKILTEACRQSFRGHCGFDIGIQSRMWR